MRVSAMFLIGIAGAVAAEQKTQPRAAVAAEIAVPALGMIADGDARLRPVLGSRAFPSLGDVLELPSGSGRVLVAPGYALLETAEGWVTTHSRSVSRTILRDRARLAALSPSGSAAAFLLREANRIVVVTGLPSAPRVAFESTGEEDISCLAVSDDGQEVLAGTAGAVLSIREGESPRTAAVVGRPTAISFAPRSRRALVADADRNQVLSITDTGIPADATTIDAPSALAIDSQGRYAAVLTGDSVVLLSLAGGTTQRVQCDFAPSAVMPLDEGALFAIRAKGGAGTWLLRTDGPEPALLYAPVVDR